MNDDITNYPLAWPFGWERISLMNRTRSQFGKHSIISSARQLENEIRLMRGRDMIISTNLRVRNDGLPYSNQRPPEDTGVAVYFEWKKKPIVFACDKYRAIEDNLWAIVKHLEALRGQERWGVGSLDQAFAGYAALPDPNERTWWDVLRVTITAGKEEIKAAYFKLANQYHPDHGGDLDNLVAAMKSALDGMCLAFGIDDRMIKPVPEWGPVVDGGKVEIVIEEIGA